MPCFFPFRRPGPRFPNSPQSERGKIRAALGEAESQESTRRKRKRNDALRVRKRKRASHTVLGGGRARKPKGGNSRGPCSPPRCAPYLPPGVTTSTSTSTSVCPHAKALAGDTTQGPLAQSTPIQTCRATLPHHALPALLRRTRHGV